MSSEGAAVGAAGPDDGLGTWVPIGQRLPGIGVPVWLYNEDAHVFIGYLVNDSDGCLWARCTAQPNLDSLGVWQSTGGEIDEECEPMLWQPLPDVPRYTQAGLDAARESARQFVAGLRVE